MQRSFSKEQPEDREFEIGGEIFRWEYPHWKDAAEFLQDELEQIREVQKEAEGNGDIAPLFSWVAQAEKAVTGVPLFLDKSFNDAHNRWKKLMARKTNPVPRHQIEECYSWLVEITGGFPTQRPESSVTGESPKSTSSEEDAS
jgi:hypothetical protein